jgi:hypothetical protein
LISDTWFEAFLMDCGLGPNEWSCGFVVVLDESVDMDLELVRFLSKPYRPSTVVQSTHGMLSNPGLALKGSARMRIAGASKGLTC